MTAFDYTQGDPALILDGDGSDIEIKGGQPVMDQGIRNATLISMFTRQGWWANHMFRKPEQRLGSDFEEVAGQAITVTAIRQIGAAAQRALKWMVDVGLALSTLAQATNPDTGKLEVGVLIEPPSRDVFLLAVSKNGPNWIAQKENPAYKRLTRQ